MIERLNITGHDRVEIHPNFIPCTLRITLDYTTQSLYWADQCMFRIERSNTDGSDRTVIIPQGVYFSYGITLFEETLYWIQLAPINGVYHSHKMGGEPVKMLYQGVSSELLYDIKAVHPDRQYLPPG